MQTPSTPSPAKVAALEKVPHAAKRMGMFNLQRVPRN